MQNHPFTTSQVACKGEGFAWAKKPKRSIPKSIPNGSAREKNTHKAPQKRSPRLIAHQANPETQRNPEWTATSPSDNHDV